MTPHRWPEAVGVTSHPAASACASAASTSFLGCLARGMLTRYNAGSAVATEEAGEAVVNWPGLHSSAGSADRGSAVRLEDYAIRIEPLSSDEGGGFLVTVPDLPGCMADGETVEQAIAEAHDAFEAWAMAEREDEGDLPAPKAYSGQFVQRVSKSLHRCLATRATAEGVSLNQLAATYLAEGLGQGRLHSTPALGGGRRLSASKCVSTTTARNIRAGRAARSAKRWGWPSESLHRVGLPASAPRACRRTPLIGVATFADPTRPAVAINACLPDPPESSGRLPPWRQRASRGPSAGDPFRPPRPAGGAFTPIPATPS